jgi:hypothetical protein
MLSPHKPPPPTHREGFLHNGRIVWALYYNLADGRGLVVWLDRDGNALTNTQHGDASKRIVAVKSGDEIVFNGERATVAGVKVFRETPPLDAAGLEWWHLGPA